MPNEIFEYLIKRSKLRFIPTARGMLIDNKWAKEHPGMTRYWINRAKRKFGI